MAKKMLRPLFETLETRQLLSGLPAPSQPPAGSMKLTGTLIGTSGSFKNLGNTAANAFDGDAGTFFDAPTASGAWAGLDLGSPGSITQIQYLPRSGYAYRMTGGVFQASSAADFSSNVVNLYTIPSTPVTGAYTVVPVSATQAFQYVRYLGPTNGDCNVAEVEFDGYGRPTAAPAAPTSVVDVNNASNDVSIAWTPDPTQASASFTVERQGPTDSAPVVVGTVTAATFDDPTVSPDTTYSYFVSAANSIGSSTLSNPIVIETPSAPVVSAQLKGAIIGTSGSYHNLGNTIANAFDGNLNTFFDAPTASGSWVGLDLGSQQVITEIGFAPRSGFAGRMVGGVFQASNTPDFSSGVVTLYTIPSSPAAGKVTLQSVYSAAGYQYVRYLGPANCVCNIAELQFFGYSASLLPSDGFPSSITGWTNGTPSPIYRAEGLGTMVNGIMYAFGGFGLQGNPDTTIPLQTECDSYNPATNTWTRLATFPEPFQDAEGVVVGDDIWFMGGFIGNYPGTMSTHVWIYDTDNDTWTRGPDLPQPRASAAAALVGNTIYVTGGFSPTETVSTTLALNLDDESAGWQQMADIPNGRNHFAAVELDGYLYAVGGQRGDGDIRTDQQDEDAQAEVDRYDPTTNTWTVVAPLPDYAGKSHVGNSLVVYDGRLVLVGGETAFNTPQADIVDYDPTTNSWGELGVLPAPRSTTLTAIVGNQLLVVAGNSPYATNTVWLGTLGG